MTDRKLIQTFPAVYDGTKGKPRIAKVLELSRNGKPFAWEVECYTPQGRKYANIAALNADNAIRIASIWSEML